MESGIAEQLQKFGLHSLPMETLSRLESYCELLWILNRELNLTRHTNYELFVSRDLVDTLQLSSLLVEGETVLDIGTGGGVPGLVLAIIRPDLKVSLCDSVAKKAKAVEGFAHKLGLTVAVYGFRAQDVLDQKRFDTLVSRAVGPLAKQCFWFQDLWHRFGRLLAIKGPRWTEERAEARHLGRLRNIELRRLVEYTSPQTQARNVILQLRQQANQGDTDEGVRTGDN